MFTDPAFIEKLSNRKRTNVTYSDFGKSLGREDNLVYHISDGFNLNKRKGDETYMEQYLAIQLALKEHKYRHLQGQVTRDAQDNVEALRQARKKRSQNEDDSEIGSTL